MLCPDFVIGFRIMTAYSRTMAPQSRGITKHLNDLGTKVFNWPGRCVDLNLIEELWKYLKGRTSGVELIQ